MEELRFSPRPLQQPRLPLGIGGSSEAAIARAARVGDGWHPANISSEAYSRGVETLRAASVDAGRDAPAKVLFLHLDVETGSAPSATALDELCGLLTGAARTFRVRWRGRAGSRPLA